MCVRVRVCYVCVRVPALNLCGDDGGVRARGGGGGRGAHDVTPSVAMIFGLVSEFPITTTVGVGALPATTTRAHTHTHVHAPWS